VSTLRPDAGALTADGVLAALRAIEDPDLHRDIVSLGFVKDVSISERGVSVTIELTTPACPVRDHMKARAEEIVGALAGTRSVDVRMTAQVRASAGESKEKLIPAVKNVIPIASGKGGVGKSTVSANLAVALTRMGASVGLMDADVYGPSIPRIMGAVEPPASLGERLRPASSHGVKLVSMGFFIPPDEAVVWRGPMLHKAVQQFLGEVEWGQLDYLLVDLPPGTGDVQLSLCQTIPLTGAVIVSTPQDVALDVARRGIAMFAKLRTPVIGMIENMSGYVCPHCGVSEDVFGVGGARSASEVLGIPFLGEIPLATAIRASSDDGVPIVLAAPTSAAAKAFVGVAEQLAAQVSIANLASAAVQPITVSF
jgi:ATP-binding protein involved in chromosome partitioning